MVAKDLGSLLWDEEKGNLGEWEGKISGSSSSVGGCQGGGFAGRLNAAPNCLCFPADVPQWKQSGGKASARLLHTMAYGLGIDVPPQG